MGLLCGLCGFCVSRVGLCGFFAWVLGGLYVGFCVAFLREFLEWVLGILIH